MDALEALETRALALGPEALGTGLLRHEISTVSSSNCNHGCKERSSRFTAIAKPPQPRPVSKLFVDGDNAQTETDLHVHELSCERSYLLCLFNARH
jgi:hypothetical protein